MFADKYSMRRGERSRRYENSSLRLSSKVRKIISVLSMCCTGDIHYLTHFTSLVVLAYAKIGISLLCLKAEE